MAYRPLNLDPTSPDDILSTKRKCQREEGRTTREMKYFETVKE
jgi:hypothetical protein